ncbi:MAG: hypothetical protein KDB79_14420, partial [Acidobacteria bacterium]|nr:hypothetical protein [Acidobacteriota bacterium]
GELPRPEFSRFLIDKFTLGDFLGPNNNLREKSDLALRILDLCEDVPYNVQFLAHSLWNQLSQIQTTSPEKAILTSELIEETLEKIVRQTDPFYTQLWNSFTSIQKKSLIASALEDGKNLQSQRVTTNFQVSASSMRKSLSALVSQDVLRQAEDKGNVKFRFEDPFFKHWINMFTF